MTDKEIDKSIRDEIKQDFKARQEKHQQIEEMAKDIPFLTLEREVFVSLDRKEKHSWMLSEEDTIAIAKVLYNVGYHKTIWHKVADGDLPNKDGAYIVVIDYVKEFNLKRYDVSLYRASDRRFSYSEVFAWTELPEYKE